jgi:hypothetical protein
MKLPEMSVIDTHLPSNTKIRGYTVEQMLAWGKACAEAEREECAKLCDDKAKETFSGQCQVWGDYFARAIRARGNT